MDQWRDLLNAEPLYSQIVTIAIDEAQCVYKWGTVFRPSYARLHDAKSLLPSSTPLLATIATVTTITPYIGDYWLIYALPDIWLKLSSRLPLNAKT